MMAGGGSQTQATGQLQYGGTLGQTGTYRMFGNYSDIGNSSAQQGGAANDHWQRIQTGFRTDWDLSKSDSLTVQGDLFANRENQTTNSSYIQTPYDKLFPQAVDAAGGDFLARWSHTLEGGSQTSLQAYYDTNRRTDSGIPMKVTTFERLLQEARHVGTRGEMTLCPATGELAIYISLSFLRRDHSCSILKRHGPTGR